MKLAEAIEIKKHYQHMLPKESYPKLIEADNLSIEALRRIQEQRELGDTAPEDILPGEDPQ